MAGIDTGRGTSVGGKSESSLDNRVEEPHKISKVKVRFIRSCIIATLVFSAWFGIWISGLSKPWAIILSVFAGFLAMVGGMIMAGIKFQDDIIFQSTEYAKKIKGFSDKLDEIEEERAQDRREFGMAALVMAKTVADKVANRLLARHASNLHVEEQREAALKEADAVVTEEILSYGDNLKSR